MTSRDAEGRGTAVARPARGRRPLPAALLVALLVALLAPDGAAEDVTDLRVGHWVRVKGRPDATGDFRGSEVELRAPKDDESLVGTVTEVAGDRSWFRLLGIRVRISGRTEWENLSVDGLEGARVTVEGHYRGVGRFSSREVARRDPGRDRLEGRIDGVRRTRDGVELRIMDTRVFLAADAPLKSDMPIGYYTLAPARPEQEARQVRDDDDEIPAGLSLTETLSFGGQVEVKSEYEHEFDLDETKDGNERKERLSFRGELVWEPTDDFFALVGFRSQLEQASEDGKPFMRSSNGVLTEAYGYWRDVFDTGVDLQVGRQDFDEPREWLYDENLDAVRAVWSADALRVELSASTVTTDGSPASRDLNNLIAYVSNNDWDRHVAVYVVDRRDNSGPQNEPIHFGARALGEWLPDHDVWAEVSVLRGYDAMGDLDGFGFDVGTTWSPESAEPWYFTVGVAHGSGDDDAGDGVNQTFRQTGLQDNNGKFGGVTSFRYYGELFEPELANMHIYTLGVGRRFANRSSLDLVLHKYTQAELSTVLMNTGIKAKPDGVHDDLGTELDVIYGTRRWDDWDVEVVLGGFFPGKAFPDADDAVVGKVQARYRF
ncbi:MAG: alginate export family protein [Planctomycetota bacterium]|jgi:hypothetical protein